MGRSTVSVPWGAVREISKAEGAVVEFSFRGECVRGIAVLNPEVVARRLEGTYPRPITELINLELASSVEHDSSCWAEPAQLEVAVVPHRAPMAAINRASRWASYCTRVAVVPVGSILKETAALEAQVRGVWVLDSDGRILVNGHLGAWPTSGRGILHWLLAEELWRKLHHDPATAVR